jgi:hypothetical protein
MILKHINNPDGTVTNQLLINEEYKCQFCGKEVNAGYICMPTNKISCLSCKSLKIKSKCPYAYYNVVHIHYLVQVIKIKGGEKD